MFTLKPFFSNIFKLKSVVNSLFSSPFEPLDGSNVLCSLFTNIH